MPFQNASIRSQSAFGTSARSPIQAEPIQLSFDSMARCENVSYIHKSRLRRGPFRDTVSAGLMREIERCLFRAFGISA